MLTGEGKVPSRKIDREMRFAFPHRASSPRETASFITRESRVDGWLLDRFDFVRTRIVPKGANVAI